MSLVFCCLVSVSVVRRDLLVAGATSLESTVSELAADDSLTFVDSLTGVAALRVNVTLCDSLLFSPVKQYRLGLDRYQYRVSANTCQYRWVSVSADTYFSIGADTSSSITCLNSQHCCIHAYSFKPIVCLTHFKT